MRRGRVATRPSLRADDRAGEGAALLSLIASMRAGLKNVLI
jgi:hypothetical protein